MPGLSDSSNLVQVSYTRMPNEKTFLTEYFAEPGTGQLLSRPVNVYRTRAIKTFEVRGLTDTYARAYADCHSSDSNWQCYARRANDANIWQVDVTIDTKGAWTEET